MKHLKYLITILLVLNSIALGKKFSDPPVGQGISTVGTGGDYASLRQAAEDFNSVSGGCTGNWTLEILNSLTEPANCAFGNTVGTNTVTIKPALGTQPTVTFTQTNVNPAGVIGHLIIGARDTVNMDTDMVKTDNFIIEGSNNGTDSRDLTLQNTFANTSAVGVIRIFGDSDNIIIRNCNIKNFALVSIPGTNTNGVLFSSRSTGFSTAAIPDYGRIENCYIVSTTAGAGIGIGAFYSGGIPYGLAQRGMVFNKNLILGRTRGIFLYQNAGGTISNNTIHINQTIYGYHSQGILFGNSNSNGWTMDIYNNVIDMLKTANTLYTSPFLSGISGIVLGDGNGTGTFNVYNNIISGFSLVPAGVQMYYNGIMGSAPSCDYRIFYNSINMLNQTGVTGLDPTVCFGIGITSSSYSGTANVKNNIVRIAQPGGAAIYKANAIGMNFNYNDWYADTTNNASIGLFGGTPTISLIDWQTLTGQDANSQSVDPTTSVPGTWVSDTDLHFTGGRPRLNPGTPISSPFLITTDIDGDIRNVLSPLPGADEVITPTMTGTVFFNDINKNILVDAGDMLTLQFDKRMRVNGATASDFYLPVAGNSLGTGATVSINSVNDTQVMITLGSSPTLTIPGLFSMSNLTAGSPSGIDISATMTPNAIEDLDGIDASDGGIPGVNDSGMDLLANVLDQSTTINAITGGIAQVAPNGYYNEHQVIIPAGSLSTNATITAGNPGQNHGQLSAVAFSPPDLTFNSDTPATLVIEYKEADAKLEAGYLETAMRIHQWKSQDSTWVLVPQTYSMQSVDTTTKTVSVNIDKLNMVGATGNFRLRSNFAEASLDKISDFGFAGNTTVVYANIALPSVGATTTTVAPAPSGFSVQGCDGALLRNVNQQFASGAELPQNRLLFSPGTSITITVTTAGIYTKHKLTLTDYTTAYSGVTVILTQATLSERTGWQNYAVLKIDTQGTITTRAVLTMEYKDHDDANNQFKNDIIGGAEYQMRIYMWREEYGFWQKISGSQIVNRDENTVSVPITSLSISQLYAVGVDTTAIPVAVDYPWEQYD